MNWIDLGEKKICQMLKSKNVKSFFFQFNKDSSSQKLINIFQTLLLQLVGGSSNDEEKRKNIF
jgi:hypothetical protein